MDIESLNALAVSLRDDADSITQITLHDMERHIRAAAGVCDELASLRFRVDQIATQCLQQDPGATRRDLLHALDRTTKE